MGNQTDYFNEKGYKHTYNIGDRVCGKFNKIPFIGSVGNDRLVSEVTGPEVTVHLDLPMQDGEMIRRVIIVKHKDIKRLKNYD